MLYYCIIFLYPLHLTFGHDFSLHVLLELADDGHQFVKVQEARAIVVPLLKQLFKEGPPLCRLGFLTSLEQTTNLTVALLMDMGDVQELNLTQVFKFVVHNAL